MPRPHSPAPAAVPTHRMLLLAARVLWVATSVLGALSLSQASEALASAPRLVLQIVWWLSAASTFVALLVPGPTSLTVARLVAPATVPAMVLLWIGGAPVALATSSLAVAAVASVLLLSAEVAELLVQGASYGDERRLPLRTPAGVAIAATVVWVVWCAVTLSATVAVWHRAWLASVVLAVVSGSLKLLVLSRMQRLSNRWLVVLPAGVVVHDPLVLGETLMVQRNNVRSAALALASTEAADLTGPAAGVAIEIVVHEMVTAVFPASAEHPTGRAVHMASFLVSPSRPGRALQALQPAQHHH